MIKFFRKIRQKLLTENKTGKYFKYAIGEITLVMVGILLALQVNNWNDQKNQNSDFDKILDALEEEIIENINETNFEIPFIRDNMLAITRARLNKITTNEFIENPILRALIRSDKLDINSDDIKLLVSVQETFPEEYKVLIPYLKMYLKIENRYKSVEASYLDEFSKYITYVTNNQTWYGYKNLPVLDSIKLQKEVEFYANSPIYKNYLAAYQYHYSDNIRFSISLKNISLVLLTKIKIIREDFDKNDIVSLFKTYNTVPFIEKTCEFSENLDEFINYNDLQLPIYNATDKRVSLEWIDYEDDGITDELNLNPNELIINNASKRMKEDAVVKIYSEGKCIKKYKGLQNGFLLIE